uniref:Uncharacterized protein n=1 Tax=Mucochytrium quahogii TaxID=96639 RepID=A0A7S2S0V3_9STRA
MWVNIDKEIQKQRQSLPTHFLLQQGLEVAYSREIARKVLDRLFRFAGREPLREPFRRWHEVMLEERFKAFVKYAELDGLRCVLKRLLQSKKLQAYRTWVEFVEEDKRLRRDIACTNIQKLVRGRIGRRVFSERKKRWYAAINIQTPFRTFVKYTQFHYVRRCTITIQALRRGFCVRRNLYVWSNYAQIIQSCERMRQLRWFFLRMKQSAILVESHYRAVMAKKVFKDKMHESILVYQRRHVAAVKIQKLWLYAKARKRVSKRRTEIASFEIAALKIQLNWYKAKEQFPAFLMMRCYLIQDEADKLVGVVQRKEARKTLIVKIQTWIRKQFSMRLHRRVRLEYFASQTIQAMCRSFVARQKAKRFKTVVLKVTRIQNFVKNYFYKRYRAACVLQEYWRYYASLHRAERAFGGQWHHRWDQLTLIEHLHRLEVVAIIRIQKLVRKRQAYGELCRRFYITDLQRMIRGHLGRRYAQQVYKQVCKVVVKAFTLKMISEIEAYIGTSIYRTRYSSATRIQSWYRGEINRIKMNALKKHLLFRNRSARNIQRVYRGVSTRREEVKRRGIAKRVRTNRYRNTNDPLDVAESAITHAGAFYNSTDDFDGMHPSIWLHRIGLGGHWVNFSKGMLKIKDVSKLILTQPKGIRDTLLLNLEESPDIEADIEMVYKLQRISKLTLKERKEQLSEEENAVLENFAYIRDMRVAQNMYAEFFPDQEMRASNFAQKIPPNTVTAIQLRRHLQKYSGRPKEAKDAVVAELVQVPDPTGLEIWNKRRFTQCFNIYRMALETIAHLHITDELEAIIRYSLHRANRPSIKLTLRGCLELRVALNMVVKVIRASIALQRAFRGRLAKIMVSAALARKRYREALLEGGLLRDQWRKQKEKEAREYEEYLKAYERHQVETYLYTVLRYGYLEIWDEYSQAYYYMLAQDHNITTWDRPIYTYDENTAVKKIQCAIRCHRARQILERCRAYQIQSMQAQKAQRAWEARAEERANIITFRIRVSSFEEGLDDDNFEPPETLRRGIWPSWRDKWDGGRNAITWQQRKAQLVERHHQAQDHLSCIEKELGDDKDELARLTKKLTRLEENWLRS